MNAGGMDAVPGQPLMIVGRGPRATVNSRYGGSAGVGWRPETFLTGTAVTRRPGVGMGGPARR